MSVGAASSDASGKVKGFVHAPALALPKGGGAVRGIGEKFAANPVTGTGSMTVPIATSPGRSGFGPELSLSYDSGAGNGPFGLGWNLSLPAITRKTDKGLPRYLDAKSPTSSSSRAPRTWSPSSGRTRLAPGSKRVASRSFMRKIARSMAFPTVCVATDPASKGCSPASSAGPISTQARSTGAPSRVTTSQPCTARTTTRASSIRRIQTPTTRPASSVG